MNEELKVIISAEINKLKQELKKGKDELGKFGKEGEKTGGKFKGVMAGIGKGAGLAFTAVASAVAAGAAALYNLAESTEEYSRAQAKLTTAFEAAGSSAEVASNTYNDLYRVLGDTDKAVEAGSHLAKLTTNEQDLAEWTKICQGAYATFGDSLPIESLTEAINETAKTGEITGALADAVNWAGMSEDEFADKLFWCNSEAEREALIRDTLNGLYGEAAEAYEKNAEDLLKANEAEAALNDSLAALGEAVRPIITLFKGEFAKVLQDIAPHFTTIADGLSAMFNGDVEGGAAKLKEGLVGIVGELSGVITNLLPSLLSIGVEIIVALVEGIGEALPMLIVSIGDVITQIATELPNLISSIVAMLPPILETLGQELIRLSPIIIQSLIDAIVILCNSIESIIEPIIKATPDVIIAIVGAIMNNFDKLLGGLITLVLAIVDSIPLILDALIAATPTVISMIVVALINALPQLIAGLIKIAISLAKAMDSIMITPVKAAIATLAGIWDGLTKIFGKVGAWFGEKFKGASDGIKKAFGSITNFFSDIWNKIKNIFTKVGSSIADSVSKTVKTAINSVLTSIEDRVNGFIDAINGAIGIINKIPGVSIGKISRLNIPKLERGGVLEKGQIGLLEGNGAEAVVPLEKNTEWLDRIAERLIGSLGAGSDANIYLQIDGKTFAQVSCDSINALTRQRGAIPLKLI